MNRRGRGPADSDAPSDYPSLAGLEEVLLEGAAVERLVARDDLVVVTLEVALLGGHPDYEPPPRGEVHCRSRLALEWRRPESVSWERSEAAEPWVLDDLVVDGRRSTFALVGTFGRVVVGGAAPRVRPPR